MQFYTAKFLCYQPLEALISSFVCFSDIGCGCFVLSISKRLCALNFASCSEIGTFLWLASSNQSESRSSICSITMDLAFTALSALNVDMEAAENGKVKLVLFKIATGHEHEPKPNKVSMHVHHSILGKLH